MIGTLFLWCFWPSFVAVMAGEKTSNALMVTYLSIASSCLVTFSLCMILYDGKLNMVAIQNSTLAGGVAIGAVANLSITPQCAILIGMLAGALSVYGYKFITPFLDARFGLKDTCGIHNLHGMPGVFGGISSIMICALNPVVAGPVMPQVLGLLSTLVMAMGGGFVTGKLLGAMDSLEVFYDDSAEFTVEDAGQEHTKLLP